MENRICYATREEAETVKATAMQDEDTFFVEIDGSAIQSERDSDFEEITLPWWEGEVVGHLVGGVPRGFWIYLEI